MDPANPNEASPRNRHYALAAALVLLVLSAGEILRIALDRPWGVFPPLPSHVVGALLAVLWTATAVTLLLRDRGRTIAKVAFVGAVLSPIVMGVHGLVTGGALDPLGLCYLPLALALALLLKGALGNGELLRLRRRHHLDEDAGLERSVRFAAGDRQASARR